VIKEPLRKSVSKYRIVFLALAAFLPALLLLLLPFYRPGEVPYLFLLFGRFHPLILHFPIVLIILALLFEISRRLRWINISDSVLNVILIAAVFMTLISISAGFFLFASGDYSGRLMEQHFWAGAITGTTILITTGLFFVYRIRPGFYNAYFIALILSNVVVAWTSHLGGSITHGQDYLTEYLPFIVRDNEEVYSRTESEMLVYGDMIAPIFEAKCISCHNETRAKGELRMTSYKNLIEGGESGHTSIAPGLPEESEVYKRLLLPEGNEDRMPPEGKTPMTDTEIMLLKYWITEGAKEDLLVADARENTKVDSVIKILLPELARYRRKSEVARMKFEALKKELDDLARELSITIRPDSVSEGNNFVIAMKFPPASFTNEQFREIAPYAEVFTKASLVASGVDDDGLYHISQMKNLRKLYLQKTKIDGSGLIHLQKLANLEVLNLSFTKVDDKAAIDLLKIPQLREVYLYRTNTSPQVIEALKKNKPGLQILMEEGPYF
jgi:uncharacterized membrane protein